MKKSLKETNKKNGIPWLNKFYIGVGLTVVIILFIAVYSKSKSVPHFSYYLIPLFIGVLYETRKLAESWEIVILKMIGAMIAGLIVSLYYLGTTHLKDTDEILTSWPIIFVSLYILISFALYDKKISTKLTEGITLLQSFAVIYYAIATLKNIEVSLIAKIVMIITCGFSLFSIYNAFTYKELTKQTRLYLSIWSSLIMLFFATIYIYRMYQMFNDPLNNFEKVTINSIHYFLLGVSSIYIVQNFFMLTVYTPDKYHFYGKNHMEKIKMVNGKHISRYSENQVKRFDSLLCLIFCLFIYTTNYYYIFVPKQTAIWITFVLFPIFIELKNKVIVKTDNNTLEKTSANN